MPAHLHRHTMSLTGAVVYRVALDGLPGQYVVVDLHGEEASRRRRDPSVLMSPKQVHLLVELLTGAAEAAERGDDVP